MSVKKKLAVGVMTGALGLSLVGGGTLAAYNDVAKVNNHFASGELNLEVGDSHNKAISFDLTNMKPGDNVQRIFTLNNIGSLAIKDVLMEGSAGAFSDPDGDSNKNGFLKQFEIDFMQVDGESNQWEPREDVVMSGKTLTLHDVVHGNTTSKVESSHLVGNKINLASVAAGPDRGVPLDPQDSDDVFIQITFKDDQTKLGNGEYAQNKYMNAAVDFYFDLEATQWDGVHVDSDDKNGAINNEQANTPDPVTDSSGGTHSEDVTDND